MSGATPRREVAEYWGGDIPWATPKDLSRLQSIILHEPLECITRKGYDSCSAALLPPGAVLFSSRAPIGLVAIAGREMATNQGFKSLIPTACVDSAFLYWVMRWSAPVIDAKASGTTFKEVSKADVEAFVIPLPPLHEQRRIATILDKADAIRRKRQEAIALTEQLLRSTFLEMFGDPVTNPKRWPSKPLREIAVVIGGLQVTEKRSGLPLEVPYLRVANVLRDKLELSEIKLIRVSVQELERAQVRKGDLLVVEGHGNADEVGRSAQWDGSITPCVHQNHLGAALP